MSSSPKLVAVTGASGYVGGSLVKRLLERGYAVVAVVRNPQYPSVSHLTHLGLLYPDLLRIAGVPELSAPSEALSNAFAGCEVVFHAANPMASSSESGDAFVSVSVGCVKAVISVAHECGVSRVVLTASMASVCGSQTSRNPKHVFTEEDWNDDCTSLYSRAKTECERVAWSMVESMDGMTLAVVNPSLIIGPALEGQPPRSSNANLLQIANGTAKASGLRPSATGVVHVDDVVEAHIRVAEMSEAAGQRFLTTLPDQYTSLELARCVQKNFPFLEVPTEYAPGVPASAPKVGRKPSSNNAKLTGLLGRPLRSLDRVVVDAVCSMIALGYLTPPIS